MNPELTAALLRALEAGGYNAKSGRLRDGCIFPGCESDSPHDEDLLYARVSGSVGYSPYPPQDCERLGEPERTPEQVAQVSRAILDWCKQECDSRLIEFSAHADRPDNWTFKADGNNLFAPPAPLDIAVKELKAYFRYLERV
jgi:hypothetical protein